MVLGAVSGQVRFGFTPCLARSDLGSLRALQEGLVGRSGGRQYDTGVGPRSLQVK